MPNQPDPNQNQSTADTSQTLPASPASPPVISPSMDLPPLPIDNSTQSATPTGAAPGVNQEAASTQAAPPVPNQPADSSSSATPPESPTVISSKPKKKFGGGKIIATILGVLLLVGGVGAGYILTQQPQIFQGKAWIPEGADNPDKDKNNPGNVEKPPKKEDDEKPSSGGGGTPQPPAGGHPGTCIDVNCALTLDSNGTYHYDSTLDVPNANGEYETIDGKRVNDYYNEVILPSTADNDCTGDGICASGSSCVNGSCVSTTNNCGLSVNDTTAPACCADTVNCDNPVCESGPTGPRKECKSASGQHCTMSVNDASCGGVNPGEPPGTNPPSTPGTTASCLNVKAYDASWNELNNTDLSGLTTDDVVNFCVTGSASSGTFDRAQFSIGPTVEAETTTKGQGAAAGDYCQSYIILSTDTTVNVKARIHHLDLNQWFGETL